MNYPERIQSEISKLQEIESKFVLKVPSIQPIIVRSNDLISKLLNYKDLLSDPVSKDIKRIVDLARVTETANLNSPDVSEDDKINILYKFYVSEFNLTNPRLSDDVLSELITYSNRIAKAENSLSSSVDIRMEIVNEVTSVLANLSEFDVIENENGRNTIAINSEKLLDVSPADKALLEKLETLILDQHDSRSSSFTKPEDRARDDMIDEVRGDLSGASRLLQRFESIMYLNKFLNDHTILNNLYLLENIIKEYHSVYELEKNKTILNTDNPDNNYYSVDLSGDLSNLGSHDSYDDMIDHMVETTKDEDVAFYLSGKDMQDENWLSKLKELKDNQGFAITDDFGFYPLPEDCQSNEDAEKYMAKEMDGKVDLNKWANGTFVEWISFNKSDQWLEVINESLPSASKEFTIDLSFGTGDFYQDGAFGPIEQSDDYSVDNIQDAIITANDYIASNDLDNDDPDSSSWSGGDTKVDGNLLATFSYDLLQFRELFSHTSSNRGNNLDKDEDAIRHLSNALKHDTPGNPTYTVTSLYVMLMGDGNGLEKLSTIFHNGAEGIDVDHDISFDLTALSAYANDPTAAYNMTRRIKSGSKISQGLITILDNLGELSDFNSWLDDKDNIEVKAVNATAKSIISTLSK